MIKATKLTLYIIFVAAVLIISFIAIYLYGGSGQVLPTYFNYSNSENELLASLNSKEEMTQASLKKWDAIMFGLIKNNKLGDTYASRVYAYVYTAQRDAGFLSKNNKHKFSGSLEPVSAEVLCLFFPSSCPSIRTKISDKDKFSQTLAEIILKKVKIRIEQDKKQNHLYSEKTPPDQYWIGVRPYYGQDVGTWKTWLIKSGHEFIAPPPFAQDSSEWNKQVELVNVALKNITPEQITSVVFWAGNPSTITPPGIWLVYANDYMTLHHVDFSKELYIRSIMAMGIADSVITAFNSKYTYWAKRPFMRDPSILTVMPTPNHPSYPAGHSTLSATAATILSFYFPENQKEWNTLASTASEGRVWGGIHFPIDAQQGVILGNKVGDAVIDKNRQIFKDKQ